jgi:hypothetical protein
VVAGSSVLAASGLLTAGCASTAETARADAVTAVRAEARTLQEHMAAAARGTSGAAQVEAVRAVLASPSLKAARHDDGVVVTGAMVEDAHAGGGLTYQGFTARLCLRFTVAQDTGETDVADARCPRRVEVEAPADETVTLN